MTRLIGYARTSTLEQVAGFDAQLRDLAAIGCETVYREQVSSVAERAALEDAIEACGPGDTLVVTKQDRLARSLRNLLDILDRLEARGASVRILALGFDTATPTGRLVLNVLGSIAQFEREIMLERQVEGIARARADGKYRGRKPRPERGEARRLWGEGRTAAEIMAATGLSRSTVYEVAI